MATERPMTSTAQHAERLRRLSEICLALPETHREDKGEHARFYVAKKSFAYYLHNHHGDGIVSVACKTLPRENHALIAAHPTRFYLPAYLGADGWAALRLDLRSIDWAELSDFVRISYLQQAPKRITRSLDL